MLTMGPRTITRGALSSFSATWMYESNQNMQVHIVVFLVNRIICDKHQSSKYTPFVGMYNQKVLLKNCFQ